ncbi:GNAT family N-acetyltransferase [Devosia sp.]|uniref:GNAT family N-acetyltransferase n=1 Tax=Devosia sp. TaxID=1871048 RepID=UPI003264A72E
MLVRRALPADIEAMSAVMTASITELCAADHHDDLAEITHWTRNKSPDGVRAMLANPALSLFVAELDGAVVGVAGTEGDTVALNYVAPEARFAGVSKALMARLEAELKASGHATGRLFSSATARRFYQGIGWIDAGETGPDYDRSGRPMRKVL